MQNKKDGAEQVQIFAITRITIRIKMEKLIIVWALISLLTMHLMKYFFAIMFRIGTLIWNYSSTISNSQIIFEFHFCAKL